MRKGTALFLLTALAALCLVVNSCKKDNSGTVENLLARGTWQLASVTRFNYIGGTNVSTDTLNTKCGLTQSFTFVNDNTCTFRNFSCIEQSATGQWQLSEDKLTLISSLSCKDTLAGANVTAKPFVNARIVNLGQYSLIIETGDLSSYYLSTDKRHIKRYGFVRF
ncbi:lipocalin family protein [Mucilaginibacter mali]|uniref:Lipocalin family protein n=1 Tax=Mucilaginibacter mali TaxID=2740462 RepID=A0A7D4TWL0_9SPHI|nr:lipocalin family protein [Mucilaginibacter mali]QKJ31535.1 lipocalin family protein [Mucilaginibacter mali]